MKVGIDARVLSSRLTGIGRYTAELISELGGLNGQFQVYTPKKPVGLEWPKKNICLRASNLKSRIGKLFWSYTLLPFWAVQDQIDVFWGTAHRLPITLPPSIPKVVTIHDMVWKFAGETMNPPNRWLEKMLMPQAIRMADRIIADSHFTSKAILAEYPEKEGRIRVVHLGTPTLPEPESLDSLAKFGIDRPYFLFVGTLEPRKNLRRLLSAFSSLSLDVRKKNILVIAGGRGWGQDNIASLVKQYKLSDQVVLTGFVDDGQLATLYAYSQFLAMPSLYEGFGLPILEATSFGIPVLTSSCASLPEVAGKAGAFVDPLDEYAIAKGLSDLLCNRGYRNALASNAKKNAAQFSWKKTAKETYSVLMEAIADSKTKRSKTA